MPWQCRTPSEREAPVHFSADNNTSHTARRETAEPDIVAAAKPEAAATTATATTTQQRTEDHE